MFKQPCYINKNTVELQENLKKIGYKYGGKADVCGKNNALYCHYDTYYECTQKPSRYENIIDCNNNEELFLALSALRDDKNDHQWFIAQNSMWDENYNGEITVYYEENEWLIWDYYSFMEDLPSDFRKATVKEIIEHFK